VLKWQEVTEHRRPRRATRASRQSRGTSSWTSSTRTTRSLAVAVQHLSIAAQLEFQAGYATTIFAAFIAFVLATFSWAYAKATKTVPDFVMDVWASLGITAAALLSVSASYPQTLGLITIALSHVMCYTPRTPAVLAATAVVFVMSSYNSAAFTADPTRAILIPGSVLGSFMDDFTNNLGSGVFAAIPIAN
jgi:hypothetical protein